MSNRLLEAAVWVGLLAGLLCFACVIFVAWQNAGSRNLALAAGTLIATLVLTGIQGAFELRSSPPITDLFSAEYTIDRSRPRIAQYEYSLGSGFRPSFEMEASDKLAAEDPKQFNDDPEKLVNEMALASFVIYLLTDQFDWQLKRESYTFRFGSGTALMPGSASAECTNITGEELLGKLKTTGNRFATSSGFFFQPQTMPSSALDYRY